MPRELTIWEKGVLTKLLSPSFPGRDELVEQLSGCRVQRLDTEGSLKFEINSRVIADHVRTRIPTEAECDDTDGVKIHFLLHVLNGKLDELEIYKDDGSQLRRNPVPENLMVFAVP
jgi:hypothetical protein